jgi:KDO2-lipid IV(A) lauroyltransferase
MDAPDGGGSARPLRGALLDRFGRLLDLQITRYEWADAQAWGRALGRLGWALARRDRRRTLDHLAIAFPDADPGQRRRLARASFQHFGCMLAEALWVANRGPEEILSRVRFEGWAEIDRARAAGRPLLIVTGHCGNWELLAAALNVRGLGMAVVARELDDPGLNARLLGLRERFGTRTILRGTPGAARQLLRTLRAGGALGMLIDQDTKVEGVWVDFFGRPAYTPVGAADMAIRLGATVLPTFIERQADGSHRAHVEPPLVIPADPVAATAAMTATIEAQIRRVPEQWVWLHRRWRRQPPSGSAA